MNSEVLIPTNISDLTETLTKDAKILYVYQCISQCDSYGVLQRNDRLMGDREGIAEEDVKSALNELEKMGLIVFIANRLLLVVQDFVIWNHFQFLKVNEKHSQFERQLKTAIKEGKLYDSWLELVHMNKKKTKAYLKKSNLVQVDKEDEVEDDAKHTNTNKIVSTSTCTSTTTSESLRDSSVSSNDSDLTESEVDDVFK